MNKPLPPLDALLPHRPPMQLLDRVVALGENSAEAAVTVRADSPFFDASLGGVPAWIGLEYLAQTVALWSGIERHRHGQALSIPLLLGARFYETRRPVFTLGQELHIQVCVLYCDDAGMAAFDGTIAVAGTPVASARLSGYRPDDIRTLMEHDA